MLTLRVSPPAHPETMPRRVEVIREVKEQERGQPLLFRVRRRREEEIEEEG